MNDEFYELIEHLAATEKLEHVLEIGSSAGGGSTGAFLAGLTQNPSEAKLFCIEISKPRFAQLQDHCAPYGFVHCYNMSSIGVDEFPAEDEVRRFYRQYHTALNAYDLDRVVGWLYQDIRYVRDSGVAAGAIERIKLDHGIENFDLVLIDGSEFTGNVEFGKIYGAKIILLDDANSFKCHGPRQQLLHDPDYELIAENLSLRNGYSAFRRRDRLPIHFFTIVLNGEPFIRFHESQLARLDCRWHWHIVEGVAELKHDTAWSVASGGRVTDDIHQGGRSKDGTSAYLDDLAARFPDRVTIYRKPPNIFWDGKREMVNAPLSNITEPCLLWQIDSDELWTAEQINAMRQLFLAQPERSAAYYWCWYFVGPEKIISTRYNYAQNPQQEWLRTWAFEPGDAWAAHEPPRLVRRQAGGNTIDVGALRPFSHDETEAAGAAFQHFAYVTEAQLAFKETYYGLPGAVAAWRQLNAADRPGFLGDHLAWVSDRTMFDSPQSFDVAPIARFEPLTSSWRFWGPSGALGSRRIEPVTVQRPRIVIDGVYWQYLKSGIGRLWQSLFEIWAAGPFADNIVILDRAGTAPRIAGLHYRSIAAHSYARTGEDGLYLEQICRELGADLFVSTYYSTPIETPSLFSGYDMIPEVLGIDLSEEGWQEKHRAIQHACAHMMISHSSARDLAKFFPNADFGDITVAHCGIAPVFRPASEAEIRPVLDQFKLPRRYLLMVGDRSGVNHYKNGALAFGAAGSLSDTERMPLVCVGGAAEIEPEYRALASNISLHRLGVDDETLRVLYAGAHALIYTSRYEGFGLPVAEAMACGCPVITCANSSLIEVAGDAGLYVGEDDPKALAAVIRELDDPKLRAEIREKGLAQVARFTLEGQARIVEDALRSTIDDLAAGRRARPGSGWREFRSFLHRLQSAPAVAAPVIDVPPPRRDVPPAPRPPLTPYRLYRKVRRPFAIVIGAMLRRFRSSQPR